MLGSTAAHKVYTRTGCQPALGKCQRPRRAARPRGGLLNLAYLCCVVHAVLIRELFELKCTAFKERMQRRRCSACPCSLPGISVDPCVLRRLLRATVGCGSGLAQPHNLPGAHRPLCDAKGAVRLWHGGGLQHQRAQLLRGHVCVAGGPARLHTRPELWRGMDFADRGQYAGRVPRLLVRLQPSPEWGLLRHASQGAREPLAYL